MKLSVAIIATGITMTEASGASSSSSSKWASLRRRLSYEKIAGYNPGSQVRLLLLCRCFFHIISCKLLLFWTMIIPHVPLTSFVYIGMDNNNK